MLMKRLLLSLFLLSLAALAQDGKPNFSGAWELEAAKSDFGPMPAPDSASSVIDHQEPKVKINSTSKSAQGERTQELTFTTDGEECTNEIRGVPAKSKTRWVERELATDMQIEFQGMKIQIKERWKLADDGKAMTIERNMVSDMGEVTQKMVYTKK